jgi:hypothetical protein
VAATSSVGAGKKTPYGLIFPSFGWLLFQATTELYLPVPLTVAWHVLVCFTVMDAGMQATLTEVILLLAWPAAAKVLSLPRPATNNATKKARKERVLCFIRADSMPGFL